MSGSDLQWVPVSVGLYSSMCCSLRAGKPLLCLGLFMSVLVSLCFSLSLTEAPAGTQEEGPERRPGAGRREKKSREGRKTDREKDGEGDASAERREQRASARQLGGGVVGATAGAGDQYSI